MTQTSLLTIGAFARSVGLTPSALRFYDDAGLLAPATVDGRTGYRYYDDGQRQQAVLVRQMRELDVPLTTMRAVLEAEPDQAEALLRTHAERLTERADRARAAVDEIVGALRGRGIEAADSATTFVVGAVELAGAIRQVAPFAAADHDEAALDCVLVDASEGELTLAATDRYRMAARTLPLSELEGAPRRMPVPAAALTDVVDWLMRRRRVRLTGRAGSLMISDHDQLQEPERVEVAVVHDRFPDYRRVLTGTAEEAVRSRVITDRVRLLTLIAADQTSTVVLQPEQDQLRIGRLNDPETRTLPAYCSGPLHPMAFSPALLASALQSSVGPDVLIEGAPGRAAVVRSADQGSFSTLVMPRRLDGTGDAPGDPTRDSSPDPGAGTPS
ncbi:MerR family transcriptional regulator [Microlunatus elymi]|uniref:MerR family transcriptional regulator n=1 Tax=Microlunatus elymi TaxID=2596828 RepID=A0A516PU13_9ACTN|nr:MerR family transcriptional regulator [Microlunatus elymi]QDP94694.1 MerR family transcriptional regulator [Microlunatus elymi]